MPTSASSPSSPTPAGDSCPRCHQSIPPGAAHGLCPACMLAAGFFTQAAPDGAPASDTTPPSPAELAPEFPQLEIIELLGRGGMGAIYKARQRDLDRVVALKILRPGLDADPSFAERFTREARALAQLNHPGIVTLHEFGRGSAGRYFILMEFVDGVNLRQLLAAGRLAPREALAIVPPLCDALQYAHDRGLVHRDIKPENILVDRLGRVKIADFGLAKLAPAPTENTGDDPAIRHSECHASASNALDVIRNSAEGGITETGGVMGTPRYMAPEQREQPAAVDHRADIYALGVVLYQMLTGELPNEKQLSPPSRHVQIDVRLDEIVLRALEKNPALRYAAASEFKTRLETLSPPAAPEFPEDRQTFFDYKSRRTLFGLPLLHIATGRDPATGRLRIARGIVAIGGIAQGVFAFGGVAIGVFSFGGLSLGLLAYGALTAGLLGVGGLGLGLLASFAGLALAPIAIGGLAVGWYAFGGLGFGRFVVSAVRHDAPAREFFGSWAQSLLIHSAWANILLCAACMLVCLGVPWWVRRRPAPPARPSAFAPWIGFLVLYLVHLDLLLFTSKDLPARVASHFNGDGHADGWMPRGEYLLFNACFPLALGLFLALLAWVVRVLPASLINLPHRDHWLAPENKAATTRLLGRWMAGPACLLVVFFAQLDSLITLANLSTNPPRLSGGAMIGITIGFLAALMVWLVGLILRFSEPAAPPAKLRRQHGILFAVALLALALPAAPLIDEWHDLPGKLRRRHAESVPAPETTVTPPLNPDSAARLPGGGYLELLGVAPQPSAPDSWWRPDGTPFGQAGWQAVYPAAWPIANHIQGTGTAHTDGRQFLFHADGPGLPPSILNVRFFGSDDKPAAFAANLIIKGSNTPDDDRWSAWLIPVTPGEISARVRVLVADGSLQRLPATEQLLSGPRHALHAKVAGHFILVGEVFNRDGRAAVPLSVELGGETEWRLRALDHDNHWHDARTVAGGSSGELMQETRVFDHLRPADVVELAIWTRPAHWVEFADVSLVSGQTTRPTITGPYPPTAIESPVQTDPLRTQSPSAPTTPSPQSAPVPLTPPTTSSPAMPPTPLQAEVDFHELPAGFPFDPATFDPAAAARSPGAGLGTPPITVLSGSEFEVSISAAQDATPPAPGTYPLRPTGATMRLLPTLSWSPVPFAAHYTVSFAARVTLSIPDPANPALVATRELAINREALLDIPLILDLGLDGRGRRAVAVLRFTLPPPTHPVAAFVSTEVAFIALPDAAPFDPLAADAATRASAPAAEKLNAVGMIGSSGDEMNLRSSLGVRENAPGSDLGQTPPGVHAVVCPTLDGRGVRFSARLTITRPSPDSPQRTLSREVAAEGETTLGTPAFLDLGLDDTSRRLVARLDFTAGDTDTLMHYPPRGTPMPDLELLRVADGSPVRLRDFAGQPFVLLFWHSLASPSHEPLAALQSFLAQHPGWRDRVRLITLSGDLTREAAASFLKRNNQGRGDTLDLFAGPDTWKTEPARAFKGRTIPTCYLIDADGRLVRAGSPGELDLADLLPKLLTTPPPPASVPSVPPASSNSAP